MMLARPAVAQVEVIAPGAWLELENAGAAAVDRVADMVERLRPLRHAAWASPVADDFAELLVRLDVRGPLPPETFAEATAGEVLQSAIGDPLGLAGPPADVRLVPVAATYLARGRWAGDGTTVLGAVAPAGGMHVVVLLEVTAGEESLYRGVFDDALDSMTGIRAPVVAFDPEGWRSGAGVAWLVVAVIVFVAVGATADRNGEHGRTGRVTASLMVTLGTVVAVAVYAWLAGAGEALLLGGVSREWVAAETGLIGMALGLVAYLVGQSLERRRVAVQSAPATGAYVSRAGGRRRVPTAPVTQVSSSTPGTAAAPTAEARAIELGAAAAADLELDSHRAALGDGDGAHGSGPRVVGRMRSEGVPSRIAPVYDRTPIPTDSVHGDYRVEFERDAPDDEAPGQPGG
jgi:hypothetical protein